MFETYYVIRILILNQGGYKNQFGTSSTEASLFVKESKSFIWVKLRKQEALGSDFLDRKEFICRKKAFRSK